MNQHTRIDPVPFIDIGAQRRRLGASIDEAVGRVLTHCQFINGPEVTQLEAALAAYSGAKHVIGCASGTDALLMVLMARKVGPGDAVFCPSFTYCATGEAVALTGATPVFVDVDETTFNIDIASLRRAIATAKKLGLTPKAIIPVDLFGQPADHDAVAAIARAEGLFVLDDAAQAFGAKYKGKRLGTAALATATSFFPAKPLGCYGDGGAIFTDDDELADVLRSIRVHGQGSDKYDNVRLGLTGRLDTIQAAVLLEKLKIFDDEIAARNKVAERYARSLGNIVTVPRVTAMSRSGPATPFGCPRAPTAPPSPPRCRRRACRPRSITSSRCTCRPPIRPIRSAMPGCRCARRCPPTSSACRCMPIWTSRPRTASSRRCATRWHSVRSPDAAHCAPLWAWCAADPGSRLFSKMPPGFLIRAAA
jgi:dTDP-4-amino-4,6-dideoxygalactose transaminase